MKLEELHERDLKERFLGGEEFCSRLENHSGNRGTELPVEKIADEEPKIDHAEVREMFSQMEEEGYGNLILGRKGRPTRFCFSGKRRAGSPVRNRDLANHKESRQTPLDASDPNEISGSATTCHAFPVRKDLFISIELPNNLTRSEADRISGFIKAVSFDDSDSDLG